MFWKLIKNFSPLEKWGDPEKVNKALILFLDQFRDFLGHPIIIHCAYEDRLVGYHPKGLAVDFHISGISAKEAEIKLFSFLRTKKLTELVGVGCYPQWNSQGFHLDFRGTKARWSQVNNNYVAYHLGSKLLNKLC